MRVALPGRPAGSVARDVGGAIAPGGTDQRRRDGESERTREDRSDQRGPRRGRVPGVEVRRGFASRGRGAGLAAVASAGRAPHAGRDLAGRGDPGRGPAGSRRRAAAPAGIVHPGPGRDRPDHPVAGAARLPDPLAGTRRQARARRAVPLQPATDHPQHGHRDERHPAAAARVGRRAGASAWGAAVADRAADGVARHPGGDQNGCRDQRRHGDDRRADRRRRIRPTHPHGHSTLRRPR